MQRKKKREREKKNWWHVNEIIRKRCNSEQFHYLVSELALYPFTYWSVRVAERLALPTSDHGVAGSNPAGGEILPEPKRRFIAQGLSYSPFHRLEITEILLKGRKTLTHPSIILLIYSPLLGKIISCRSIVPNCFVWDSPCSSAYVKIEHFSSQCGYACV